MLFVLAVFAISNILSIMAPTFNMLLFARILPAFLHPIFWSIALSTASTILPAEQSPKAVGIVFGGFTIASVFGIPLATLMADLYNWQASFVLCAVVNILSFFGMLFLLPATPKVEKQTLGSQIKILKKPLLWISFALSCFMIASMYSTYGYISDYLGKITKMNGTKISLMLFFFGITGVVGNWVAGKFLSKSILLTTLVFIIALALVHTLLYFCGFYFFPMVIMVALWGFVHTSGFLISNINFISSAEEAPEFVNSIFTTCGNLAVTIGSLIGGFWITHFSIHNVVWSSVLLLFSALIAWFIKRYVVGISGR
jgi:DHA1 family inner membrane transport protein